MIELKLNSDITRFKTGELIEGEIVWEFEKTPDSLILEIGWITNGKGTVDTKLEHRKTIKVMNARDQEYFNFVMPKSPYSFKGKLIELNWFIRINDTNNEMLVHKDITLGPNRNKIVITQSEKISKLSISDLSISES